MDPDAVQLFFYILGTVVSAAFAGGGAYFAVKVKLEYLDRAVTENREDIKALRNETKNDIGVLHSRINDRNRAGANAGH